MRCAFSAVAIDERPALPISLRVDAFSASTFLRTRANASGSPASNVNPFTPFSINSLAPAAVETRVGLPELIASTAVKLNTSQVDGIRLKYAAAWRRLTSDGDIGPWCTTLVPQTAGKFAAKYEA